jgi:hypothetical protein
MLREFQAVFVFDEQNYRRLAGDFPFIRKRLYFVGALKPDGPLFVADPFGLETAAFEQCYQQIAEAISGAVRGEAGRTRPGESVRAEGAEAQCVTRGCQPAG